MAAIARSCCCVRTLRHGTPKTAGVWVDEGLNKNLRDIAVVAHRAVWARGVLLTFRESMARGKAPRRA
eukprot:2829002-Alexandrium_andersonii.AAC.1